MRFDNDASVSGQWFLLFGQHPLLLVNKLVSPDILIIYFVAVTMRIVGQHIVLTEFFQNLLHLKLAAFKLKYFLQLLGFHWAERFAQS